MTFILLEIGVRVLGVATTYSEKTHGEFHSYYNQVDEDGLHTWGFKSKIVHDQTEFNNEYVTNSLGLREKELSIDKKSNVFRAITIGDSFTEGDGVAYEDSYPRYLEEILNAQDDSIIYEVYNAGVSGSDIFYMNNLIVKELLSYKPDVVIYLLNNSDVEDVIYRGGRERFHDDGSVHFKKGPWFFPFYKYSHLFRHLCNLYGLQENLLTEKEDCIAVDDALKKIGEEIRITESIYNDSSTRYIILSHPMPSSIKYSNYADYNVDNEIGQCYENRFFYFENKILNMKNTVSLTKGCFNTFKPLEYEKYAWPINGHFNEYGYEKLAVIVYGTIQEEDPTFFNKLP